MAFDVFNDPRKAGPSSVVGNGQKRQNGPDSIVTIQITFTSLFTSDISPFETIIV